MQIIALNSQRTLRDLSALAGLCDGVTWLDEAEMAQSSDPAVIVGAWLMESPGEAKRLISARCDAGAATIVVPRWKPGNVSRVIAAPSDVNVIFHEFDHFDVDRHIGADVSTAALPGQSVIKTPLHNGRWGNVKAGATILAYRPSEGSGAVVLCTAALTSQRFGVDGDLQRSLLTKLIGRATGDKPRRARGAAVAVENVVLPKTVGDFLRLGDSHAAVTLAAIVAGETSDPDRIARALEMLGMELKDDELQKALRLFPSASVDDMESALKEYGWSAYLRLARQAIRQRSTSQPAGNTQGETIER